MMLDRHKLIDLLFLICSRLTMVLVTGPGMVQVKVAWAIHAIGFLLLQSRHHEGVSVTRADE